MMSLRVACLFVETLAVLSCRDPSQGPPASAPAKSRPHALPEIPDFAGGTEEHGPTYTRRTYARGPESITVTLARFPMSAPQYEGWLRMSTADFPQAALEVRPDEGNGFYQCAPEDASRCDLLVQLRCGIHLEIRGQGIALRQDADAILRGLDLPTMAKTCRPDSISSQEWKQGGDAVACSPPRCREPRPEPRPQPRHGASP